MNPISNQVADPVAGRNVLYEVQSRANWKEKWLEIRKIFDETATDIFNKQRYDSEIIRPNLYCDLRQSSRSEAEQTKTLDTFYEKGLQRDKLLWESGLQRLSERIGKVFELQNDQVNNLNAFFQKKLRNVNGYYHVDRIHKLLPKLNEGKMLSAQSKRDKHIEKNKQKMIHQKQTCEQELGRLQGSLDPWPENEKKQLIAELRSYISNKQYDTNERLKKKAELLMSTLQDNRDPTVVLVPTYDYYGFPGSTSQNNFPHLARLRAVDVEGTQRRIVELQSEIDGINRTLDPSYTGTERPRPLRFEKVSLDILFTQLSVSNRVPNSEPLRQQHAGPLPINAQQPQPNDNAAIPSLPRRIWEAVKSFFVGIGNFFKRLFGWT